MIKVIAVIKANMITHSLIHKFTNMHLDIVTPEKNLYSGEIELVQLPGKNGSFEILNNHAPIVSTLEEGRIKIKPVGEKEIFFEVKGGVIECKKNTISVLADL